MPAFRAGNSFLLLGRCAAAEGWFDIGWIRVVINDSVLVGRAMDGLTGRGMRP
jgi:hypothetical protein